MLKCGMHIAAHVTSALVWLVLPLGYADLGNMIIRPRRS
jgi:hypothetical protein